MAKCEACDHVNQIAIVNLYLRERGYATHFDWATIRFKMI